MIGNLVLSTISSRLMHGSILPVTIPPPSWATPREQPGQPPGNNLGNPQGTTWATSKEQPGQPPGNNLGNPQGTTWATPREQPGQPPGNNLGNPQGTTWATPREQPGQPPGNNLGNPQGTTWATPREQHGQHVLRVGKFIERLVPGVGVGNTNVHTRELWV